MPLYCAQLEQPRKSERRANNGHTLHSSFGGRGLELNPAAALGDILGRGRLPGASARGILMPGIAGDDEL